MQWKVFGAFLAAVLAAGSAAQMMVGGTRDIDINDDGVRDALDFAVARYNLQSNDQYQHLMTQVVRAQSQVVSGVLYTFTVKMARSNCRKGASNEVCVVPADPNQAQTYECVFKVWNRPWLPDIQVKEHKCSTPGTV